MQPVNRSIGAPNIGTEGTVRFHPDVESPPRQRINASVVSAIVADHILAILGLAFLIAAARSPG